MFSVKAMLKMLVSLIVLVIAAVGCSRGGYVTTKNLKEIMIGRCWEYQRLVNPTPFLNNLKDCGALWELFYKAVSFKSSCGQQPVAYGEFTQLAKHQIDGKRLLLWEKVYPLVTKYADLGKRFVTLDSTLAGYMASSLVFCGNSNTADGLDYGKCPGYRDCPDNAFSAYWKEVSKEFSKMAEDPVYKMVNGSQSPTYRADSIFAEWELPYLPRDKVKTIRIMVVHNIHGPVVETCSSGATLSMMKNAIQSYGFNVECEDDPEAIHHFLCVDAVDTEACKNHVKRYIR
ncbi:ADP-ribosyl cyclase/cyclic ADP-ribose hydrolase-like [Tubulanus polymorphus]|uniref:ADP-ribosyl cyclase/cyclic ADP-ribose hydrolase-like n=1 Tax=Tubulanus polymorphus TaxID=672921 RepID=UPI003DA597A1